MKKPIVLGQRVVEPGDIQPAFKLPPEGQRFWDEAVLELAGFGAATSLDVYNLSLLAVYWAQMIGFYEVLLAEGHFDIGSTGQMRSSPVATEFYKVAGLFTNLSKDFGLTLSARTGLELQNVTTRSIESDLNERLGVNPRRTNRAVTAQKKKQIEKG